MNNEKVIKVEYNIEFENKETTKLLSIIFIAWTLIMYLIYSYSASLFTDLGLFDKASYIESQGLGYLVVGIGIAIMELITTKD